MEKRMRIASRGQINTGEIKESNKRCKEYAAGIISGQAG